MQHGLVNFRFGSHRLSGSGSSSRAPGTNVPKLCLKILQYNPTLGIELRLLLVNLDMLIANPFGANRPIQGLWEIIVDAQGIDRTMCVASAGGTRRVNFVQVSVGSFIAKFAFWRSVRSFRGRGLVIWREI